MVDRTVSFEQKITNILNDMNLYIKLLEQRIVKVESEIKALLEKSEKLEKRVDDEKNVLKNEISSIKNLLSEFSLELDQVRSEIKSKADIKEIKELKNLLDLLNPLKSVFATKEEVKKMLSEAINTKTKIEIEK